MNEAETLGDYPENKGVSEGIHGLKWVWCPSHDSLFQDI